VIIAGASYVWEHGHETSVLRVPPDQEIQDINRGIVNESPNIVGLSLTTRQWLSAVNVAHEIREKLDIPIIAGGLHHHRNTCRVFAVRGDRAFRTSL
jgi:hypothetical protein